MFPDTSLTVQQLQWPMHHELLHVSIVKRHALAQTQGALLQCVPASANLHEHATTWAPLLSCSHYAVPLKGCCSSAACCCCITK
jgi:hypothetical protein